MLVLTRKMDQSVIIDIGDGRLIEVMVVNIRGDKVRLGCTAPKDVLIHRDEIHRAIHDDQQHAPAA